VTGASVHSTLSPPSGVPQWQTRAVSETVFDFMHGEMIRYFSAQLAAVSKQDDARVLARRLHVKLEGMGFGVGQRYVERCSRDHPLLDAPLDIVKFVCKELWSLVFKKQIDKLQTNYKGIYVLHDANFRWLQRLAPLSGDTEQAALLDSARVYTSFACGILRGALWNLGLNASVKADLHKLPAVQFTLMEEKAAAAASAASARNNSAQQQQQQGTAGRPGSGQAVAGRAPPTQPPQQPQTRPASGSSAGQPRPGHPSAR
jgi:hypothetical protein